MQLGQLVRETTPKVVLCDLGLPGIDGIDVCRSIRSAVSQSQPIIVALTGWGRGDDRQRTKDAGFDHHLVKPVSLDQLFDVLRTVSQ